jgi:hypothetical protein
VTARSEAARLLALWVRTAPKAWMFASSEFCVLSGRGLCVRLITSSGGTLPSVVSERHREATIMRRPWPTGGCCAMWAKEKHTSVTIS